MMKAAWTVGRQMDLEFIKLYLCKKEWATFGTWTVAHCSFLIWMMMVVVAFPILSLLVTMTWSSIMEGFRYLNHLLATQSH